MSLSFAYLGALTMPTGVFAATEDLAEVGGLDRFDPAAPALFAELLRGARSGA